MKKKKLGKVLPQSWLMEKEKIYPKDAIFEKIFGAVDMIGKPSKDWRNLMPKFEPQNFGDCVSFSRTSTAESKSVIQNIKDDEGNEFNFSDLDLAVGSGTTQQGNSLREVAEYARKTGVSLEKDAPYTLDWNQRQVVFNAAKTRKKYKLGSWSWVNTDTNTLKNALEVGPLQIGIGVVPNWNSGGILKDTGKYTTYHAIVLNYIDAEGNKYIFDSYEPNNKVLDKDYKIYYAMSFKELPESWRGIGIPDADFYQRLEGKLIIRAQAHGEVYRVQSNFLQKVDFLITDQALFDTMTQFLREHKVFIGISEADFARLEKVATTPPYQGIKEIEQKISLASLINNI